MSGESKLEMIRQPMATGRYSTRGLSSGGTRRASSSRRAPGGLDLEGVDDGVSKVLALGEGQTCEGDAAVLGHVDGPLVRHVLDLLGVEAREGEHPDLVGHEGPVLLGHLCLEGRLEARANGIDASGHHFHLLLQQQTSQGGGGRRQAQVVMQGKDKMFLLFADDA